MKILAFLGNPGNRYLRTRHNIGFIIGEYLCDRSGIVPKQRKFGSFCGTGSLDGTDVCALFPQTFMNNSGLAVEQAASFYKLAPSDVIAVHDEIEFPFGKFGVKFGGGHKGHNGIRSIVQHLGSPDFARFRFGVGRPDNPAVSVADYVLSSFSSEEMKAVMDAMPDILTMLKAELKAPH